MCPYYWECAPIAINVQNITLISQLSLAIYALKLSATVHFAPIAAYAFNVHLITFGIILVLNVF